MAYSLRLIGTAAPSPFLPDFLSLKPSMIFSEIGSVSFDYAVKGVNAQYLADQVEIAIFDDQGEVPDTRFIIEGSNRSWVSSEGQTYRSWKGRTLLKIFGETLSYWGDWPTTSGTGNNTYTNYTPGAILSRLISKAQSLGEAPGITWTFNETTDSNGNAWTYVLGSYSVDMGVNLLQVIQNMVDQGLIEVRMVGRELRVVNPNALGTDRSTGTNPVVLWASQNAIEAPEQTDSAGLRTVALVKGDDGVFKEVQNPTAVAKYGRRAMFVSQGGVKDQGTLTVIGDASLARVVEVRSEKTYKFNIGSSPVPFRTFQNGDWILTDMTGTLEKLRIRQISIDAGSPGEADTCTLTLNDLFLENEIRQARKVNGITGGSSAAGSSLPSNNQNTADTLAPAQVAGLGAVSNAYIDAGGVTRAQITASWGQVTQNADGSILTDLDHYEVRWQYKTDNNDFWRLVVTDTTSASWSEMLTGKSVIFRVRAVDRTGNGGTFSALGEVVTAVDNTPPPVPSTPQTSAWLATVRVIWDGLGSAGEAMPADFAWIEVHASYTTNFTPDTTTLVDYFQAPGVVNISGRNLSQPTYVKFVAVDRAKNKSAASAQGSATPLQVTSTFLGPNAVGPDQLQFKESGNLVTDGSFENGYLNTKFPAPWTYMTNQTDAPHGSDYMRMTATSGSLVAVPVTDYLEYTNDDQYWGRIRYRMTSSASTNYPLQLVFWFFDKNKNFITGAAPSGVAVTATGRDGTWKDLQTSWPGHDVTPNAGATYVRAYVYANPANNIGSLDIDAIEVRQKISTAIVDDAIIGRAAIQLLAVDDARIASASIGKLTTGNLISDMTVAARIKTADSGARVELSALGLQAFNSTNVRTALLSAANGSFQALGSFTAGSTDLNKPRVTIDDGIRSSSGTPLPGVELSRGDYLPGGYQAALFNFPYPTFDGGVWLTSWERLANNTGRSDVHLSPAMWHIGSVFDADLGGKSVYISGDRRSNGQSGATADYDDINIVAGSAINLWERYWWIGHQASAGANRVDIKSTGNGYLDTGLGGVLNFSVAPNGDIVARNRAANGGTFNTRGGRLAGSWYKISNPSYTGGLYAGALANGFWPNDSIWFAFSGGTLWIYNNDTMIVSFTADGRNIST